MGELAIRVEGLGKKYQIGSARPAYRTLRETITDTVSGSVRRAGRLLRGQRAGASTLTESSIWALKDITLDIGRGEIVGVIGRNGAGKSTLFKILSQITEPTEGQAKVFGRVGTLLEVGTGFHAELTGRENIYLNGAILGMKRAEIDRKFDEIVDFSEIEKFIDTPVKYYSSGMGLRLGFAVAAHLEPDIMLVDEVLAVGDLDFQKKCLGKMGSIVGEGRTVVFVSHQMNAIRKLCDRCVWLDQGRVHMDGLTPEVVGAYEASFDRLPADLRESSQNVHLPAQFIQWEIVEPEGDQPNWLTTPGPMKMKISLQINQPIADGTHGIALHDANGQVMWAWSISRLKLDPGRYEFMYSLPGLPLRPGYYRWLVSIYDEDKLLDVWNCVPEMLIATTEYTHRSDEWGGVLNVPCEFKPISG